jgi:hydrogenase maturation protease
MSNAAGGPATGRPPRVAVLGLGNVLMRDDAFGPHVVLALEAAWDVPPGVRVQDVGTPGLDLAPYIDGLDTLILVDTVNSDGPPGTLRTYRKEALLRHPPQPRIGPHDPGVKEALLAAEFEGTAPRDVLLVGVIPGVLAQGAGLSPAVRAAIPAALTAVLDELARLGVAAAARPRPGIPDIWWEKA